MTTSISEAQITVLLGRSGGEEQYLRNWVKGEIHQTLQTLPSVFQDKKVYVTQLLRYTEHTQKA